MKFIEMVKGSKPRRTNEKLKDVIRISFNKLNQKKYGDNKYNANIYIGTDITKILDLSVGEHITFFREESNSRILLIKKSIGKGYKLIYNSEKYGDHSFLKTQITWKLFTPTYEELESGVRIVPHEMYLDGLIIRL